jgi:thymidylate kinase
MLNQHTHPATNFALLATYLESDRNMNSAPTPWPRREPAAAKTGPLLVSFSGIDGAGKTTQIENLVMGLQDAGLRVRLVAFWDDVATCRRLREAVGHAVFRGEIGVGAPGKPVNRRDKNIQNPFTISARMFLCLIDAVGMKFTIAKLRHSDDADVIVFDRYLYDQLVNLGIRYRASRLFTRILLKLIPHPDIAYLLDADPALARARKPEYPIDFLRNTRACYLAINKMAGMNLIHAGSPQEVSNSIRRVFAAKLGQSLDWAAPQFLTGT